MENRPPNVERPGQDAYQRVARYDGGRAKEDAERAYRRSRNDLQRARAETELSVFRLQIGNQIEGVAYLGWYVTLIGRRPDEALATRLEGNLADGTAVELPEQVIAMLRERRERNTELAPWIERRYGRLTRAEVSSQAQERDDPSPTRK